MDLDLQRIRCLQFRMRKKPLPKKEELQEQQQVVSNSKQQSKMQQQVVIRIQGKLPPKTTLHISDAHQPEPIEGQIVEDSLNKKNRKITQFFGSGGKKANSNSQAQKILVKPVDFKKNCSKQLKIAGANQILNSNPYLCLQDQNKSLRERLKQKEDQFSNYKKKMKEMTLNYAIKNHQHERNQVRTRVSSNRIRLGEFIIHKESGKIAQSWVDGQQIKAIKAKLEDVVKRKQLLQNEKQSLMSRLEDSEKYDVISCQLLLLSKDQAVYKDQLQKLEDEKNLHIKDYKRLYEEDNSKYAKANSQLGLPAWPNIKNYQMLCLLGKGGFSQVYKAFDTEELREVACKIHEFELRWADDAKDNYIRHALRESNVHKLLKHPHIVSLYNTVQIDRTSFMTVMEFCDGPDMSYYLRKYKCIPEKQAKLLLRQILHAIKYMHQLQPEKVIHYDLKPQNIIFHKGALKVTDFGLCKIMKDGHQKMQLTSQGVGTYWYLPPECFIDNATITTKVDIWSIGVVYYEMLFHQKPFGHNMSQVRILKQGVIIKAMSVPLVFPQKPHVSQESKDFILACLKANEAERITANEALRHKLFDVK